MSKIGNRYWLEPNASLLSFIIITPLLLTLTPKIKPTSPDLKYALKKFFTTDLHTTQFPDLFIFCEEGFDMNTGKRNPLHLPVDDQSKKYS